MKIVRSSVVLFSLASVFSASFALADEPAPAGDRADRPAVHAALKRSESTAAATDLGKAAGAGNQGQLVLAARGPVEAKDARLATIGGTTTAQGNSGTLAARVVDAPKSEGPAPTVGRARRSTRSAAATPAPGAERVIASLGPSLAACVKADDANATGTAVIGATVTAAGDVTATSVVSAGGIGGDSVACFRDVVVHANFGANERGSVMQIRVSPQQLASLTPANTTKVAAAEPAR